MIESSYFRRRFFEMKGCYLEKWLIPGSVLIALFSSNLSAAQVVGDTMLPTGERSQVTGNPNFQIDGGTTRGGNLFHSFSEFSVPTGGSAYFNNAVDVQNIFSRVTGGSISNIDGVIRANGTANLFLLNPNGILFGPNASLNIGGSFVATTASEIGFPNGEVFSSDATQPLPSQLLNVNPNALFFNQLAAQSIVNQSIFNDTGLQVPLRQNLLLVGGPVQLDGGRVISPGSYVELGSVGGAGTINLSTAQEDWQLNLADGVTRADALLRNGGDINVKGDGGSIRILSRNIDILGSTLRIEIPSDSRFPATQTGDLELNATGSITISDSILANSLFGEGTMGNITLTAGERITIDGSALFSTAEPDGMGDMGDVTITAGTILFDNTLFVANTSQPTDASDVFINARDTVSIDSSTVYNTVEQTGIGNGGDINITTGSLAIRGTRLLLFTRGQGNVGDVNIDARDTVSLDGSFMFNTVNQTGIGNGGGINITTGSFALTGGTELISNTDGQGDAGSVNINARDLVSLDDGSDVFNFVGQTGIGNSGGINITTGSLALTEGSQLVSDTNGRGDAGSVNINARDTVSFDRSFMFNTVNQTGIGNGGGINITTGSLALTEGSQLVSNTNGQGNTGRVTINARDLVSLDDGSDVFNFVGQTGIGNSSGINITTGLLALTEGSQLVSDTNGRGDAGSVNINARNTVSLDNARVFNVVRQTGIGNGGGINITTGSLALTGGGQLVANTDGQGSAGDITINARDRVLLDGVSSNKLFPSSIFTQVASGATGQGGDVTITTGSLFLINGGAVNTNNVGGTGNSGQVTIDARDSVQIRGTAPTTPFIQGGVFTSVFKGSVGSGGAVSITTGSLSVSDQGRIFTDAEGQGNAGNIQIRASNSVLFDDGDAISTLSAGGVGRGGDIDITTRSLSVLNNAQLSASTSGNGDAGNITVSADTMGLSQGGRLLTTTFSRGQAGNITVNTPDLQLVGADSGLFAQTTTAADAGNLTIQPRGNGQSVRVNLQDGAQISASTSSSGRGGTLTITAPDSITLTGSGSVIAAETGGTGTGGNLFLTTGDLRIQDQAEVTVSSSNTGSAGSLFVDADLIYLNNGGRIRADTSGGGGNINLRSPLILLRNGSSITTDARGSNIPGGNISIDTDNLVAVPNENSDISANSRDFRGGNVTIRASGIFGIDFREQLTPLSDITATGVSEEFSGTVELITPGIDPARGLAQLPTEVVDASDEIAQACRDVQGSSFVVTGRGGLPPTPQQALGDDPRWRDWRTPAEVSRQSNTSGNATLPSSTNPPGTKSAIVEATGWVTLPDGQVSLTASVPNVTSSNRLIQPVNCDGS